MDYQADDDQGPPNFAIWLLACLFVWALLALAAAAVLRSI